MSITIANIIQHKKTAQHIVEPPFWIKANRDRQIQPSCFLKEIIKNALQKAEHCCATKGRDYLFENCGARRAALSPYFFLSFIRGSRVKKPAALSAPLFASSATKRALAIP